MIDDSSLGDYGDTALGNCKAPFAVFIVINADLYALGDPHILIQDGIVDHGGAFHIYTIH